MQLTDTHCHIQSVGGFAGEEGTRRLWEKAGEMNADEVIARASAAGVTRLVCVGCTLEDSRLATEFVHNRQDTWATIGIHPHEANRYASNQAALKEFALLASSPKVVAVGETGLDYFYEHSDRASQLELLDFQIGLATEHDLPLIFHVREAFDDFWPVFERHASKKPIRGVLHSFTDSAENLERGLRHGLYVGVNGIATFTKKPEQLEAYRRIPLDRLLLETDAPFLTPVPFRGKICEPYHIRTIAEFMADLRGETLEVLASATTHNAQALFGI